MLTEKQLRKTLGAKPTKEFAAFATMAINLCDKYDEGYVLAVLGLLLELHRVFEAANPGPGADFISGVLIMHDALPTSGMDGAELAELLCLLFPQHAANYKGRH